MGQSGTDSAHEAQGKTGLRSWSGLELYSHDICSSPNGVQFVAIVAVGLLMHCRTLHTQCVLGPGTGRLSFPMMYLSESPV